MSIHDTTELKRAVVARHRFEDTFRGDDSHLLRSVEAYLSTEPKGAQASELLNALAARLESKTIPPPLKRSVRLLSRTRERGDPA